MILCVIFNPLLPTNKKIGGRGISFEVASPENTSKFDQLNLINLVQLLWGSQGVQKSNTSSGTWCPKRRCNIIFLQEHQHTKYGKYINRFSDYNTTLTHMNIDQNKNKPAHTDFFHQERGVRISTQYISRNSS